MADRLPLELVTMIARFLMPDSEEPKPLHEHRKYSLVCRKWRAAFEPFLYDNVRVWSHIYPCGREDSNLMYLCLLTSGPWGEARRAMIRTLDFTIEVERCESQTIAIDFAAAALLFIMSKWGTSCSIHVNLSVLCQAPTAGPVPLPTLPRWNWSRSVKSWTQPLVLYNVQCVQDLSFSTALKPGEVDTDHKSDEYWWTIPIHLAQYFQNLEFLFVSIFPYSDIPDDHLQAPALALRRYELSQYFCRLPSSIRDFHIAGSDDGLFHMALAAPSHCDPFATCLRELTLRLESLTLTDLSIQADFLCPLNTDTKPWGPIPVWPKMREILIIDDPFITRIEGGWEHPDESDAESAEELDFMHRAFISAGYAAHNMPHLTSLAYQTREVTTFEPEGDKFHHIFDFSIDEVTGTATLTWRSKCGYRPDERVAEAWGFQLRDITVKQEEDKDETLLVSEVNLPGWYESGSCESLPVRI
ncbi:uncharacterized protein BJX67DRAFT_379002 [Aspergillus lucknowensis]|uniref:F-box domain-containing protein n=1 Tax=Aspergillus lucknowensis TaxID=176173 RepID=A0ABR4LY33_9EURO